jgi:hypothetical protein
MVFFIKKKPSELIYLAIKGGGNGFEIDDILSQKWSDDDSWFLDDLLIIAKRYQTMEFPVGISNPDCHSELILLAKRLQERGM